jgi:cbb3-type cytochrome oxidase maturation protein
MNVLYVALPVAVLLGASALVACILCIRKGQFDDLDTPPMRMLIDDPPVKRRGQDNGEQ